MDVQQISQFLLWALVFIFSTTVHEASHAWAAKLGGDPTAYHGGVMTLDPMPHIRRSPFGMVIVPIISFFMFTWMMGWASAPYDPTWASRHPHRSALMALAGPASNLLLAILAFILIRVGLANEWFFQGDAYLILDGPQGTASQTIAHLLSHFFTLNVVLFTFNLIPIPPLDGSQGILIFFKEKMAPVVMEKMQAISGFGLILAFLIFQKIGPFVFNLAWVLALT